jgi:hypothetical protein
VGDFLSKELILIRNIAVLKNRYSKTFTYFSSAQSTGSTYGPCTGDAQGFPAIAFWTAQKNPQALPRAAKGELP